MAFLEESNDSRYIEEVHDRTLDCRLRDRVTDWQCLQYTQKNADFYLEAFVSPHSTVCTQYFIIQLR